MHITTFCNRISKALARFTRARALAGSDFDKKTAATVPHRELMDAFNRWRNASRQDLR